MITSLVDVAIIGGGPAGLAAAIKAKEAGAENATMIERSEAPGGAAGAMCAQWLRLILLPRGLDWA
jgi:flavin-dependent dehydrogenase